MTPDSLCEYVNLAKRPCIATHRQTRSATIDINLLRFQGNGKK